MKDNKAPNLALKNRGQLNDARLISASAASECHHVTLNLVQFAQQPNCIARWWSLY